jgi:hypothetical protein
MQIRELSPKQIEIVTETIRNYGTVAMAARNAGLPPTRLKQLIAKDEELKTQVEDAMSLFKDSIHMEVLERATVGKSDAMLKLLAENQNPEAFKVQSVDNNRKKPTGLTLRVFGTGEDGEVSETKAPPSVPQTFQIGYDKGRL